MKKSKKILALVMSVMVVGGIFTGCGSKNNTKDTPKKDEYVTIDDLVTATKDVFKDKKSGSVTMDLGAGLKLVQNETSMDVKVTANFGCEADEDTTSINGKLDLNMTLPEELMKGVSEDDLKKTMEFKSYTQKEDDKNLVYNYDSESEKWSVSEEEIPNVDTDTTIADLLDSEVMNKLTVATVSDGYTVSGKVSVKDVMNLTKDSGVDTDSLASLGIDLDALDDVNFDITFSFGNDKVLKSVEATVKSDGKDIEYQGTTLALDDVTIKFTVNKVGDITVDVPSDVKDSANDILG